MPTAIELKEERAKTWGAVQEILDRNTDPAEMPEADAEALERAEADLDRLSDAISKVDRAERLQGRSEDLSTDDDLEDIGADAGLGDPAAESEGEDVRSTFNAYLRNGFEGLTSEQRSAMELRFNQVGDDGLGGYTVAPEFWNRLSESMATYGGMIPLAFGLNTNTGATIPWPTTNGTAEIGEILATEDTAMAEEDITFGTRNLGAHTYSSKGVRFSRILLQDSSIDVEGLVARRLGERLGRITAKHAVTGSGTGEPLGLVTELLKAGNAERTVVAAGGQIDAVTYDDIVDLEHAVNTAYRTASCQFVWNDQTLKALRKLKDADGRPLWQPSVQAGVASAFNGRGYAVVEEMPDLAADAMPILFGDIAKAYIWRSVRSAQVLRDEYTAMNKLQIKVYSWMRADGGPDDLGAVAGFRTASA